ncbi:muts domain V-domain-containing protein [Hypoxylon trugodes]|uniref:muts domain V-domain-containing protein n=1 Tax=Hypoxylon trugodes TaxID=326681 RepID=UPI00218E1586|nr:muts domain V-domain-containing protein [Hypoxylon trugodes]KAI1383209.1 muts domain V-domain-containing protein [Hypoxylon trugodes]
MKDDDEPKSLEEPEDEGPAYPTVVLQAWRNMQKFENCVLLTRVGGFYELYLNQAEEYGPLLNLKVAQKKTNAGPVPMAGFPFFQLERFLKTLVLDLNCYVAIAEEFPNDPGDRIKSNGLMHDRRVTRVITPGTLIDENFMDPYANNYVMAVHVNHQEVDSSSSQESNKSGRTELESLAEFQVNASTPIGLAWVDISTGQFYTQATTVTSLGSILSRVGPREVVVDELLESQKDHHLFSVLAEDKQLITFAPHSEHLPLSAWTPMLESDVPTQTAQSFTPDEVQAGSLLLQYVRDRLQGLSMKLQPPQRYENMSVMSIDKSTMRSLEIKQTIRDSAFRGSLLHIVRRTVTKGGARLLNAWLSAPSTCLKTITSRQDLVKSFIQYPDLRDEIVLLLRRSHDSQRLVQKFALGRGDPDDLIALANTIRATQDIVSLLGTSQEQENTTSNLEDMSTSEGSSCFDPLLSRIKLKEPAALADRIKTSIDEDGLVQQHRDEDSEASQLMTLAEDVVASEGAKGDPSILPKAAVAANSKRKKQPTSIRDHYSVDDNIAFVMKPEASHGLRELHNKFQTLLQEKTALAESLRTRFGAASLTLRWTPTGGHVCHVKGVRDMKRIVDYDNSDGKGDEAIVVSSSRSTRTFHASEWTALGRRLHQTRFEIGAEEQRIFADLRAMVVANLVKLRRNAAVLDELDVTASFARLASEKGWTRPVLLDTTSITNPNPNLNPTPGSLSTAQHIVIGGRHPTVEAGLREQGRSFTENDCLIGGTSTSTTNTAHGTLSLITGPNMAGKSTYLRQNALIAILAQAGCWVPASHATLGIADAVFSRVGSADNLFADQSTFMVEMLETSRILRAATPRSFVIMDEVGRGTAPHDGAAVAFAALYHLVRVNRCRALFATHFHGLADMVTARELHVDQGGVIETWCTDVEESEGGFIYVHKLRKGVNRQSHALKVARLAGLPEAAIAIAREILGKHDDSNNGKGDYLKKTQSQNTVLDHDTPIPTKQSTEAA